MNIQNGQALTTAISAIDDYPIIPNCMVEVLPRTWPGINKIGGIAKVVKCHYIATSDDGTKENNDVQKKDNVPSHIDVRYVVMGGRERMVPMEYCRPAPEYDHQHQHQHQHQHPNAGNQGEQNNSTTVTVAATHARTAVSPKRIRVRNLRDRSALLGRCNLCGSLRSDCGSCDWVKEQQERKWILEQEKMGILVLSGSGQKPGPRQHKSESARARRRRRDTNVKQRSPRRFGKDKEIEDEISFRHSDSDSDEGSFDSSSDESFVFDSRNKDSRTRRHTVTFTSASKFHRRRTLLTSSSDSSEGDNDSSSTSSSDDDEILARLKAIHVPSAKLKIAKKRARRLARISSKRFPIHGVGIGTRTSNHSKLREASTHIVAQQRKERRLKTARKYKMSNEKYKARMRFLNRRLSAMSHKGTRTGTGTNAKKKKEADGDGDLSVVDENSSAGAKTRMGRKGIAKSVLESIGTKATSTDETAADILAEGEVTELSQRAQNNGENGEDEQQDELLSHFVVGTTSRDKLQHARADKDVPIQVQSKHIPKSKDSSDLDSNLHQHEKSTTSRQLSQSQDMYPNADSDRDEDDDGDEDEGMSMMSPTRPRDEEINESAVPNTNTTEPRETRKRIGFVDGEDIGEKEIDDDNDDNIDDGQNADVAMDNIREIEGTELTRNYAENEISGYYEEDPILNTFIQPEGEEVADNLPSDLVDRSADLAFWDLPGFYDQQEKDLTVDKIPSAEAAIYSLEVELKNVQSSSSMMAVERIKLLLTIESRCREKYEGMSIDLIRNGTDQCRCALKRFGKKKEFRKANSQLSKRQWRDQLDLIDIRFDDLDKRIESVLRRARNLLVDSSNMNGFNMDEDEDEDMGYDVASDSGSDQIGEITDYSFEEGVMVSSTIEKHPYASSATTNSNKGGKRKLTREKTRDTSKKQKRENTALKRNSSVNKMPRRQHHRTRKSSSNSYESRVFEEDSCDQLSASRSGKGAGGDFRPFDKNNLDRRDLSTTYIHRRNITSTGIHQNKRTSESTGRKSGCEESGAVKSTRVRGRNTKAPQLDAGGIAASFSGMIEDVDGVDLTIQGLYDSLGAATLVPDINTARGVQASLRDRDVMISIPNACETLSNEFPSPRSNEILLQLPVMFDDSSFIDHERSDASVSIFNTLLELMKRQGKNSIQELVSMNSRNLLSHLDLLHCAIGLIRRNINSYLKPSDGSIHTIFSKKAFLKMVMLQIIDLLYSQLLPKQWGSPKKIPVQVYERVCALRDELGQTTHTVEDFSKIILTFPCQKWYASTLPVYHDGCSIWYVSSVAPGTLESFWQGQTIATGSSSKANSRIFKFKKFIPRIEIDALWGLMAWFARSCSSNTTLDLRWRFTASLFTFKTGSLGQIISGNSDIHFLPPSANQIRCCAEELLKLTLLLESGAMDPLPADDGILVKILEKSVALYSQRQSEQMTSQVSNLSNTISRKDIKIVFKAWQESDLSHIMGEKNLAEPLSVLFLRDLFELKHPSESSFFSLVPSSEVLTNVLHLLHKWIIRMPNKKARWSRFGDTLLSYVNRTLKDAGSIAPKTVISSDNDIGDVFAQCFSKNNAAPSGRSVESSRAASLCEALVYIVVLVRDRRAGLTSERDNTFPLQVNLQFCEMIWNAIADDEMKAHRSHLDANSTVLKGGTHKKSSSFSVLLSMKIFSLLMLQVLDQNQASNSHDIGGDMQMSEGCITFILSCLLSAIISACEYIDHATHQVAIPASFASSLYGGENTNKVNVLSCGLLWLSCIVHEMNRFLYDSKSLHDSRIKCFERVLDHFIPKVIDTSLICLKEISSGMGDKEALGSCYRACLALLRNTINAFILRHHSDLIVTPQRNEEVPQVGNRETEFDDMFNEIDDDVFLAIDLEQIVGSNKTSNDLSKSVFNDAIKRDLLAHLLMSLRQAKPSLRYMIGRPSLDSSTAGRNGFTNDGKAACAVHSAGICAVIASLSVVHKSDQDSLDSLLQSFLPRTDSTSAMECKGVFGNDDTYLNDIRHCLCAELCHVSQYSHLAKDLQEHTKEIMLRTFVSAMTNASVMNAFPTMNHDIMTEIGGIPSKIKEERLLIRVTEKLAAHQHAHKDGNPDVEGLGLKRRAGDYFDTPGVTYLSSHLWTFCKDLGMVLKNKSELANNILCDVGAALLTTDGDLDQYVRNISSDTLESLSQISLERECLKRLMKVRSVLSVCLRDPSLLPPHQRRIVSNAVSSLISGILLDMSLLLKGADYYERNSSSTQPYVHAKTLALLAAYDNFMASTFSWLLSQLALADVDLDKAEFLFRFVILPCLKSRGLIFSNALFKAADKRNYNTNQRTVSFECGLPGSNQPTRTIDNTSTVKPPFLVSVLSHHMREIVVYAGSSQRDDLFYELMSCIVNLNRDLIKNHLKMVPAIIDDIEKQALGSKADLETSSELYLSLISMSESHNYAKRKTAVNRFRTYVIRSFLLPKLKHPKSPPDQKMNILNLLLPLLDVKTIKTEYEYVEDFSVSLGEEVRYLHLNLDIKHLVISVFECLDHAIVTRSLVEEINCSMLAQCFECLQYIISMKIEGSNFRVLKWCKSNSQSNEDAYQISLYLEALCMMSRFFTSIQSSSILRFYRTLPPSGTFDKDINDGLEQFNILVKKIHTFDHGKSSSATSYLYGSTNGYTSRSTRGADLCVTEGDGQADTKFPALSPHARNCLVAFQEEYADIQK